MLDAACLVAQQRGLITGRNLVSWFPPWLDDLEVSRSYVAIHTARSIWKNWLSTAPFAELPLKAITARSIEDWLSTLSRLPSERLSDSYIAQILQLLRKGLEEAKRQGYLDANPSRGIKPPRRPAATSEPWTYLDESEQRALLGCKAIPEAYRLMLGFAIYTGLRGGEQFCLRLEDVRLSPTPHVFVRFGSKDRAPKSRRLRRVPLIPAAVALVERWLEALPTWCPRNARGLLFPGERGGMLDSDRFAAQKKGQTGKLAEWMRAAGIKRRVRWHDLRHTCAASLVTGWWGRAWRLEEVRDFLGHASIDETQRYAHLAPAALQKVASETGGGGGHFTANDWTQPAVIATDGCLSRHSPQHTESSTKTAESDARRQRVGRLAEQLLRAVAAGESPGDLPDELANAVLATEPVRLAFSVKAGGPFQLNRALELARAVLPNAVEHRVRRGAS